MVHQLPSPSPLVEQEESVPDVGLGLWCKGFFRFLPLQGFKPIHAQHLVKAVEKHFAPLWSDVAFKICALLRLCLKSPSFRQFPFHETIYQTAHRYGMESL